jgi:pSer/pThr/pTyr-binding forkhead associated (FHA) protein
LVDLGSVNGTQLNGQRVDQGQLSAGDVIRIGNSSLRFEAEWREETADIIPIDNLAELEHTVAQESIAMTINDTSRARLVVNMPERTWEVPILQDRITIGRNPAGDIFIDHPRASRNHALLERREDGFVLRDLGSTNGTWFGSERITEHRLASGDTLQIGPARLVFKDAIRPDDLTMVEDTPTLVDNPRIPVVFVPGLMGSNLWLGGERVWPNVRTLFTQPEIWSLPDKVPLEPRGIVNEVVIVPNLIKQEMYGRLGDFLVESLGYQRQVDLIEFAYDWRQDVRVSAQRLAEAIEQWNRPGPVALIAHSLGSLVSRYYIERLGGKKVVERVIFLGGPHYGVPRAIANLMVKADLLPFGVLGDRLRAVLRSFPSMYQILPIYDSAFDQKGHPVNIMEDESWLPQERLPLLRQAHQFRQELGRRVSIPAVSVFGYGLKTVGRINVERTISGEWKKVDLVINECGDAAIPDQSTVLEGSEIHPVQQHHGSLYIDNDVKVRLKMELSRRRRRE